MLVAKKELGRSVIVVVYLNYMFHVTTWSLRKSKRPVKSIGAAKVSVDGGAVDIGNVRAKGSFKSNST